MPVNPLKERHADLNIPDHAYFLFSQSSDTTEDYCIVPHSTHAFQKSNRDTFFRTISLQGLFDIVRGLEVQSKPF